jgi:hypothetical protein
MVVAMIPRSNRTPDGDVPSMRRQLGQLAPVMYAAPHKIRLR